MKIETSYPPNIEKIKKVFTNLPKGIIFAYGKTIYNPDDGKIDEALLYHESTHMVQQGDNPEAWWDRYLADKDFRFTQELEAYQNQYKKFCELIKDKNIRARFIFNISRDLSSEIYGNICSQREASVAIKNGMKFNVNKPLLTTK